MLYWTELYFGLKLATSVVAGAKLVDGNQADRIIQIANVIWKRSDKIIAYSFENWIRLQESFSLHLKISYCCVQPIVRKVSFLFSQTIFVLFKRSAGWGRLWFPLRRRSYNWSFLLRNKANIPKEKVAVCGPKFQNVCTLADRKKTVVKSYYSW